MPPHSGTAQTEHKQNRIIMMWCVVIRETTTLPTTRHVSAAGTGRYYKLNKLYNDIERKKREIQKLQMELGAGSSLLDATIKEKFGTNFTPPMPPERHHYQHPAPMNHSAIPYDQYWHNPQYFHQWTWRHNHYYAQPSMVTAPTNIQQIADTGVPALHELLDDSELENL